jgi:sigma-B regulation protein RsbU (phosphoserine phosphatase)
VLGLNLDSGERFERLLEELIVPIKPGDLFFFFTDGVSEAMDAEGACFGESRVTAFLSAHADLEPDAIRDRLVKDVAAFAQGQPQHDDLTMLIVRIERVAESAESDESRESA